ncbi:MAG: L-fucose:H+ symporter permease [Bacteroides sp.]|nr:L-fucose:H+ symporter permease [Bacteroides sp.]MCM1412952.1 L-fucose:H+ symporter permease [Bacteroides sp.]MCM1471605.1 L-fucose:H+ symporter permease [Bacteroides sp.]
MPDNIEKRGEKLPIVPRKYLLPFILVTALFALWGFANDITNPMVAAFQTVMDLTATKASMVQFAFYGGYATMAIPAALFIRRYSYKTGILIGLGLYAIGAFLFIPAAAYEQFSYFCISLYVLTFGLAFLETTANPYILSMGPTENSTRRLNLAQAFNPVGSLSGMAVASLIILPNLISDRRDAAGQLIFSTLPDAEKAAIRVHDLAVIRDPYVALGLVVLAMFIIIALVKMPRTGASGEKIENMQTLRRLFHNHTYCFGVIAQIFYVGAQIMVWTFIIQYAERLGFTKAQGQAYNICAMGLALLFRFIGTFVMRYIPARRLLVVFGCGAMLCTAGAIFFTGVGGLYALVGISAFMSIMFPSIYGISLERVDSRDTYLGAAFLVMAIVGGALMPPMQASIIDLKMVGSMPAVNVSFALPFVCFLVVTCFGLYSLRNRETDKENLCEL